MKVEMSGTVYLVSEEWTEGMISILYWESTVGATVHLSSRILSVSLDWRMI